MTNLSTISQKVEQLGSAWEQFKQVNDRRISEIERKGNPDPLTVEQLNRINNAMDVYKSRMEQLETVVSRPAVAVEYGQKAGSPEAMEHKEAFKDYLRRGVEDDLAHLERKALSVGTDADGGYLVTPLMSKEITRKVFESSPMRQLASVTEISTDSLEIIEDYNEAAAGWAASETASVSDTNTPQIGKNTISTHELVAQPKATQKLIDDASIDVEQWLAEKLVDKFSRLENTAFISGDGSGKPTGILSYTAGTSWGEIEQVNSGTDATITADGIINLYFGLKEDYAKNATFLMNRASVQAVRLLKESTTDQYLWQPGLAAGTPDTLLGVPVMQAADMPTPALNSLSVAIADFRRAYQIVDRTGIRILRDPYTDKPFVKFYTTKRVGGEVTNFDAIKLLKLAA